MFTATAQSHSLADVSHLPWWAQLAIGLGLICGAVTLATVGDRVESMLLEVGGFLVGLAGLGVLWGALFGN